MLVILGGILRIRVTKTIIILDNLIRSIPPNITNIDAAI